MCKFKACNYVHFALKYKYNERRWTEKWEEVKITEKQEEVRITEKQKEVRITESEKKLFCVEFNDKKWEDLRIIKEVRRTEKD